MIFTLTIQIEPPGVFGVPQEGTTVIPAEPGEVHGHTFHSRAGVMAGYGTLSKFRDEQDAIRLKLNHPAGEIRLNDNFGFVQVDAPGPDAAYQTASSVASKLLRNLMIENGQLFTFKPLILESEDGSLHPLPKFIELGRFTSYDLAQLSQQIHEANSYVALDDTKLDLAIDYLQQGLLLFQKRKEMASVMSRQHSMVISSAFLNIWKSITVIVGDPSKDSDYQSRYKALGLDYSYFDEKIEKVRQLRNEYDVAHYSLESGDIEQVEQSFGEAVAIATELLQKYRNSLKTP